MHFLAPRFPFFFSVCCGSTPTLSLFHSCPSNLLLNLPSLAPKPPVHLWSLCLLSLSLHQLLLTSSWIFTFAIPPEHSLTPLCHFVTPLALLLNPFQWLTHLHLATPLTTTRSHTFPPFLLLKSAICQCIGSGTLNRYSKVCQVCLLFLTHILMQCMIALTVEEHIYPTKNCTIFFHNLF